MNQNNSPWIHQLKRTRPVDIICEDMNTDITVIGGGISGVMTSYFTLKNTDRSVTLIEGDKVAHGATGHNAGQILADFEREFTDLVREYGLKKSIDAENAVKGGWALLDELYTEANLTTPLSTFIGYNGYKNPEHVIEEIKTNYLRKYAEAQTYPIYIAEGKMDLSLIPKEFEGIYEIVPQADILSLLETGDSEYICAVALKKGCVNSALLSEEIVGYLLSKYKGRFTLYEHSNVKLVELYIDNAKLTVATNRKDGNKEDEYTVETKKVIFCTNGFERIRISNQNGDNIDAKFHHMVNGDIGYMSAYIEEMKNPPTALGYYDHKNLRDSFQTSTYFYATRRPYELEDNQTHNLVCIGGPEEAIAETQDYNRKGEFSKEIGMEIDQFVKKTMLNAEKAELEYKFQWHGMMCYTPTNMRVIGPEPKNEVLMYNLGCNGVGILPSIHGGWKISRMIAGDKFEESIFDPKK